MKRRTLAAALLLPFAALACAEQGQQDGAPDEATAEAADTAAQAGADAEADGENEVTLATRSQSGVTGTAGWEVEAESVSIELDLEGLKEGQQYPAHVHQGTCESGGGVAAGLNPVAAESDGTATAEATVARADFSAGQTYFVQVHLPDGTPAACGDLPKDAGLAPAGGGQGGG